MLPDFVFLVFLSLLSAMGQLGVEAKCEESEARGLDLNFSSAAY
jgi:hypothetical protein